MCLMLYCCSSFSLILCTQGTMTPVPDKIHNFDHRISAFGSSSRPSTSLFLILPLFSLAISMIIFFCMYIHRRAPVRSSMQGMLNGTFHISYNTGFPLAGVRFAPRPKSIKERRLSRRTGGVVCSTAAFSTFRAITTAITAAGGTGPSTRSLSTALAGTGRARRFGRLRKGCRFSRTGCASITRLFNRLRVRAPCICSWPVALRCMAGIICILGHDRWKWL